MFKRLACTVLVLMGIFDVAAAVPITVIEHNGNNDPFNDESWDDPGAPPSGITRGPITGDVGGFDAWAVDDVSVTSGFDYRITPLPAQVSSATTLGWKLSARLRVVDVNDTVDTAVLAMYRDGSTAFRMNFGSDADGDPIVVLAQSSATTGPSFTLEGAGSTYHLYEAVWDPNTGTAELFVDGISQITGWTGIAEAASSLVLFGAPTSTGTGEGRYNLVQFQIDPDPVTTPVPEPSTLLMGLVAMGGVALGRARRRRQMRS